MEKDQNYISAFNRSIGGLFRDALRLSLRDPAMALFLLRTIRRQGRAARLRLAREEEGTHVPPFIILSVTNRCNLRCRGCYAQAQRRSPENEMSGDKLRNVIREASELGVSIVLVAGGEPFTRPEILDIVRDSPPIVFAVFTNGLLIDPDMVGRLQRLRNLVPVVSLEGDRALTDQRRGDGVHEHLLRTMGPMKKKGIFFGVSLTVTSQNLAAVTDLRSIRELTALGSRLFFFVEYVPVQAGTEDSILTDEQRQGLLSAVTSFRMALPGLFIAFPGGEEEFGGCLAAGRGFVHISPEGRLEPCPFAPYSDVSLDDLPLKEALQSPLLRAIRDSSGQLSETRGGCALWARREWVASLLR